MVAGKTESLLSVPVALVCLFLLDRPSSGVSTCLWLCNMWFVPLLEAMRTCQPTLTSVGWEKHLSMYERREKVLVD